MPPDSPTTNGAPRGRRPYALLITPPVHAYRDHTGRRVDPLLRLHRVTLGEARQARIDLSLREDAPQVTAAIEVLTTASLPMRPAQASERAQVAGELYALQDDPAA